MPLPAAIGGKALITAATAGDPAAAYEVAARFAEGKGVPQDLAMAAAWFDRAARRGIAPAQFRLGSMYEKGVGLKKDLQEARRLYLAAADKGNAKAMHNLAVLYAEGIDGKPEYAVATQWFRKAAAYGVVDSQYNLAILYARGVGIEHNLAESYKWFALAPRAATRMPARKSSTSLRISTSSNWPRRARASKPSSRKVQPGRSDLGQNAARRLGPGRPRRCAQGRQPAAARAFDEKAESIVDSHDGTNQIQHPRWYKGASHEWESLIPTICANVSLLRSKPAIPVWKLPSCTTWL